MTAKNNVDVESADVRYRGTTMSDEMVPEPDTEVVVTDRAVHVRPLEGADPDTPLEFSVPLSEIESLSCEGFVCRSVTLDTGAETYEVPTEALNELKFRQAIIDGAELSNPCYRLGLDRLGFCPCEPATIGGCVLCVLGIGFALTIVGAAIGAVVFAAGLLVLGVVAASRKFSAYRGSNVWKQENGGKAGS